MVTVVLLLVDIVKYPGFIGKHLFFDSRFVLGIFLLWVSVARFKLGQVLPDWLWKTNSLVLLPVVSSATIFLTFKEFTTYANFAFSTYKVHPSQLFYLLILNLCLLVLAMPERFLKKTYGYLILVTPFILLGLAILMRMWTETIFFELLKEDMLVEYLQFGLLASSMFLSGLMVKFFVQHKMWWGVTILYGLMTVGFFLLAGEEISWGQRIFKLKVDETVLQMNTQQELTMHNNEFLAQFVGQAYLLIGLYGAFSWIMVKTIAWFKPTISKFLGLFSPPWYSMFFYFFIFRFNYIMKYQDGHYFLWGEFFELLLAIGFFLFMAHTYFFRDKFSKQLRSEQ